MKQAVISLAAHNWPFDRGFGKLLSLYREGGGFGTGERTVRTRDGFDITVLADDLIGEHILLSGGFDRAFLKTFLAFAEPGDRIIDIGANIGYVSSMLLHSIKGSHVVAVEPQPGVAELLTRNLSAFDPARYRILRTALSDGEGEAFLRIDSANRGGSHLVDAADDRTVTVPMRPAAEVFAQLDRLDLMKIDIEGHEEPVFRSALPWLDTLQPRAILFEDHLGASAPDGTIGKMLVSVGYAIFAIHRQLLKTRLERVTADNVHRFSDFIAVSTRRKLPQAAQNKVRL